MGKYVQSRVEDRNKTQLHTADSLKSITRRAQAKLPDVRHWFATQPCFHVSMERSERY